MESTIDIEPQGQASQPSSSWTRVEIRPGDPNSAYVRVFDRQKTLEYWRAAEQYARTPEAIAERMGIRRQAMDNLRG